MEKLNPKTVRLLRRIKRIFLKDPRKLDMDTWGFVFSKNKYYKPGIDKKTNNFIRYNSCGTVGCIAGFASLLSHPEEKKEMRKRANLRGPNYNSGVARVAIGERLSPEVDGAAALGLTKEQSHRLFYLQTWATRNPFYKWPDFFVNAYRIAKTPKQRTKITVARIEHFIQTGGAE